MLVADDHGCATGAKRGCITSPSAPQPQRKIFQDGAEVNLRHAERHGDVLELLALLGGDAVVGDQREIGGADDLLLGLAVEHGSRRGELGEQAVSRGRFRHLGDLLRGDRPLRLVLIDLLHEADLTVLKPAGVGRRDRDHRLQDEIGPQVRRPFWHNALLAQLPPIVPGRPRFAKLAYCREIGIQLGSISLYDAGDASFIPLTPRSASDDAQSDLPRRYAAWPLPPRRRRHCRAGAAAPGRGHAHSRAPALDRADALAAPAHQRQ